MIESEEYGYGSIEVAAFEWKPNESTNAVNCLQWNQFIDAAIANANAKANAYANANDLQKILEMKPRLISPRPTNWQLD